ncbi:unnamed protein product, partial [Symbiodinium necroappetens]
MTDRGESSNRSPTSEFASANGESGNPPQTSPKRAREDTEIAGGAGGEGSTGDQPLTLALLQQALQVSQQQITNTIHASLEGTLSTINTRVAQVEANMEEHVKRTTNLLDAMTDRHCHIEGTVKQSTDAVDDVRRRLELLEGKFAAASFAASSTRTTDGGGDGGQRPAIVAGGWDADQDAETTLKLVKEHIERLQVDLDLQEAFVPGLRRGFAILPVNPREGEGQEPFRNRVRMALKQIREARIVTGDRPEGGHRYFWAAMSESPERRKRAQFSGKVKRLILGSQGDRRLVQVEFGTGNVWYDGAKIASAVTSTPPGGEMAGVGWINLPSLARQLGTSLTELTDRRGAQDTDLWGVHVLTWNVGGLTIEKSLQLLRDLRKERIHPFDSAFILCLQEIIMEQGKAVQEQGDLQCICGKQETDWRGTGIVHTSQFKRSRNKLLRSGYSSCLTMGELRVTVVSGHMPHHATMAEADEIATSWLQQLRPAPKAVLGMDANETFSLGISGKTITHSGRGEQLLAALGAADLRTPPQQLEKPSFFPYNTTMRPRRLDYIVLKHLLCQDGKVLSLRDVASSDHEPIHVPLQQPTPPAPKQDAKPWGSRRLQDWQIVEQAIAARPPRSGDMVQEITNMAVTITRPGRALAKFVESKELRRNRRDALLQEPGPSRKAAWKAVQKQRREEHRTWRVQQLDLAGQKWWKAKEAVDRSDHDSSWELRLRADERWRETLKLGKACGPDSVSHEALRILEHDDKWRGTLLYVLNDMLYTAAIPPNVVRGITVLLAKTGNPDDWSDTRPITLSSALLKTFSQLLIGRVSHLVQQPSRLQWARRSRQGVELILILRRVCRVARDWGIPMYIAKLDIRKAFDSIYQEALAEQIESDVGIAGDRPWEARAWTHLIHADEINVYFRGEEFRIPQTNGVRQGAPDSPIAFGRVLAVELERAVQQAEGHRPRQGDPPPEFAGAFMDDSYIWSTKKDHLQAMLTRLGTNLPPKGLDIHPLKTEIIDNQEGGVEFEVGGRKVLSKGPDHVIRTLGSPVSFSSHPSTIIAEMQARGRHAFRKHRGTLLSNAPLKSRLQMSTILVRQSALWACQTWPCNDTVLRAANSLQLVQARNMLKLSRQPGELWADWHVRSMRRARLALFHAKVPRWSSFILQQIWGLAGHVVRGDPVAAAMLRWRNLEWWRIEQSIPPSWGGQRHARRFNPHLDVERQIVAVAGDRWHEKALDRIEWSNLEELFVEKFDIPWASGDQAQLQDLNLAPNFSHADARDGGDHSDAAQIVQLREGAHDTCHDPRTLPASVSWLNIWLCKPVSYGPPTPADANEAGTTASNSKKRQTQLNREPSAGHGSQRVMNKARKYIYKQQNKAGNYQRRPPPQNQQGPGWGILYAPQNVAPEEEDTQTATAAAATPEPARGTKADTHNQQRQARTANEFADLLNRHLLPRGTIGPNTGGQPDGTPDQAADNQHTQAQPRATTSTPTDDRPTASATTSSPHTDPHPADPARATATAPPTRDSDARPERADQGTATDKSIAPTPETAGAHRHQPAASGTVSPQQHSRGEAPAATSQPACGDPNDLAPLSAVEQEVYEWCTQGGHSPETLAAIDSLPPDAPLSGATQGELIQLTHGCWQLTVQPSPGGTPPAGRFRAVMPGEQGTATTAPYLTCGLVGTFAPLSQDHWVFLVTQAPGPLYHEHGAMLLQEGDKLLFEHTEENGWMIRMESHGHSQDPIVNKARRLREAVLAKHGPRPGANEPGSTAAASGSNTAPSEPKPSAAPRSTAATAASENTRGTARPSAQTPSEPQQSTAETSPTANPSSTGESEGTWQVVDPPSNDQPSTAQSSHEPAVSYYPEATATPDRPPAATPLAQMLRDGRQNSDNRQQQQRPVLAPHDDWRRLGRLRHLRSIAMASRDNPNVDLSYAHIAPHVGVVVTWLNTMAAGDVRIHAQLPPLLTPLREILSMILEGTVTSPAWNSLVSVTEALERVISPCAIQLSGECAQSSGDRAQLSAEQVNSSSAGGQGAAWSDDLDTLRGLLRQAETWPLDALQMFQDLAMQLVRGIARRTPPEDRGQPTRSTLWDTHWWESERHHGLGDAGRSSLAGVACPRVSGAIDLTGKFGALLPSPCGSLEGGTASPVLFGKIACLVGESVSPPRLGIRRTYSSRTCWGPFRRRATLGGGRQRLPVRDSGIAVKLVHLLEPIMSGGSGHIPDLSPTPVFDSPPTLPHGGGGYQADLLNLQLDSPGEPVGGSPPKRTRQAESSPGGLSDSTGLEENVTMEAIARTLQHQLQQERQVLTGEIQRAMYAVGMLQDLAGVQKKQGEKLETVAAETQTLANRIVDLESRLQQIEAGGGGGPRGANVLEDDAGNRNLGMSEDHVKTAWLPLATVATWNVGGGGPDKMLTLLDSFAKIPGLDGIRLLFLQELSLPVGDTKVSSARWQLLGHKKQEEWRGVGVAYDTRTFTHTAPQHKANMYSCVLHSGITSFVGGIFLDEIHVGDFRDVVGSDHEPILGKAQIGVMRKHRAKCTWGAKQLKTSKAGLERMQEELEKSQDHHKAIAAAAAAITEAKKGEKFVESKTLKETRRKARGAPPGEARRQLWKQVCSERKREHREWVRDLAKRSGGQDWGAYRALKRSSKPSQWDNSLREQEQWREEAQKHFKTIFAKIKPEEEEQAWGEEVEKLRRQCKRTPWVPFREMELRVTMQKWHWGKATGVDGIAHEALLYLLEHPVGKCRLMEIFNDALYTGRIPQDMLQGLTVLLPKTMMPQGWGDTRPITLSSALLKWLAQLLLHRGRCYLDAGNKHQWAKPGSQAVELVLGIRRLLRAAKDWGDDLYVVKLDVAKAFDSISQLHMGKLIAKRVGGDGGQPWEALLWLQLLRADNITLAVCGELLQVPQTNGVRQGSPDSPVVFSAAIGETLDEVLAELQTLTRQGENPKLPPSPQGGASFLDDTYLWSHNRRWLVKALEVLENKLGEKNLVLNAKKTQAIANVEDKGDAIMTILGSPVTFDNVPAVILGGPSERARKAFHANKAVMCSTTSVDEKLKAMLALVRPAALWACSTWPVNDALLRGINTVQLQLLRKGLGGRRRPGEEWVEWNQRSLRLARLHLGRKSAGGRWSTFVLDKPQMGGGGEGFIPQGTAFELIPVGLVHRNLEPEQWVLRVRNLPPAGSRDPAGAPLKARKYLLTWRPKTTSSVLGDLTEEEGDAYRASAMRGPPVPGMSALAQDHELEYLSVSPERYMDVWVARAKTQFPQEDPYQPRRGRREELKQIAAGAIPAMPPPPDRIYYDSQGRRQGDGGTREGDVQQGDTPSPDEQQQKRAQPSPLGGGKTCPQQEEQLRAEQHAHPKAPPPKPPSSSEDEWPSEDEAPPEDDDAAMVQLGLSTCGGGVLPRWRTGAERSRTAAITAGRGELRRINPAQMAATLVEVVRHILRDTLHATSVRTELAEVGELLEDVVADFGASIRLRDSAGIAEGRNALMEAVDILDQIVLNYDSEHDEFTMDPATLQDDLLRLAQQLQIVVPAHDNLLGDIRGELPSQRPSSSSQELFEGYGDEMGLMQQLGGPGTPKKATGARSSCCPCSSKSSQRVIVPTANAKRTRSGYYYEGSGLLNIDGMNVPAEERVRGGEDEHPGLAGIFQNHEGNARDANSGRHPRRQGGDAARSRSPTRRGTNLTERGDPPTPSPVRRARSQASQLLESIESETQAAAEYVLNAEERGRQQRANYATEAMELITEAMGLANDVGMPGVVDYLAAAATRLSQLHTIRTKGTNRRGTPLPTPNAFEIAALTVGVMEESSQQGEQPSMAELLELLELVQAGMALLTRGRHSYNWQVTHWATDAAEEALALLS